MKVILVGYPGSQKIVKASKYLTDKYLPAFEKVYLNYKGEISGWAKFVSDYLRTLPDERVIFSLDDYLISGKMNMRTFLGIEMGDAVCVKLCFARDDENEEYPITTQYTLWDRRYLIELLDQVGTPWEFELKGSRIFKASGRRAKFVACLPYFTNSSLSSKWDGVHLIGLKDKDINEIKELL